MEYQRNPFYIGVNGVKLLYKKARGVFWFALIIGIINGVYVRGQQLAGNQKPVNNGILPGNQSDASLLIYALVLLVIFIILSVIIWGLYGYTSARIAQGQSVTIKAALKEVMANFWQLLALGTWLILRILGWTLLFIIPGIIMAVRYSLTPVVFFAEPGLGKNATIKRSSQLTKGAWFETYAAQSLLSLLTLGFIDPVVRTGASAILYRQLKYIKQNGLKKPRTHWLSYFVVLLPIILGIGLLLILGIVLGGVRG